MTVTLVDTGPLVAAIDRGERHHPWARAQLAALLPPLFTCEAVLAEAAYLLRSAGGTGDELFTWLQRGALRVDFSVQGEHEEVGRLFRKSAPRMDFADACMVRMSEKWRDVVVLTLDRDFHFYRRHGRKVIPLLMPG